MTVGGVHNRCKLNAVSIATHIHTYIEAAVHSQLYRVTYIVLSQEPTRTVLESGRTDRQERGWTYVIYVLCHTHTHTHTITH